MSPNASTSEKNHPGDQSEAQILAQNLTLYVPKYPFNTLKTHIITYLRPPNPSFSRREIPPNLTFSRFHFLAASPTPLKRFLQRFRQTAPLPTIRTLLFLTEQKPNIWGTNRANHYL